MKRLIITICTLLLLITSLWAQRQSIVFTKSHYRGRGGRSIAITPSAYLDGSTIYLYSKLPLDNLQATIKDETGQVISEETIFVSPQQPYTSSIENVEEGVYTLELNDGKDEYYGYFEINQ